MTGACTSRSLAARTAQSLHRLRQPLHVVLRVKPVGIPRRRAPTGHPALTLLDTTELPLGGLSIFDCDSPASSRTFRIAAPYRLLYPSVRCCAFRCASGSTAWRNWFYPRWTSRAGQWTNEPSGSITKFRSTACGWPLKAQEGAHRSIEVGNSHLTSFFPFPVLHSRMIRMLASRGERHGH